MTVSYVSEDTTWGGKLLPTFLFSGSKDIMNSLLPLLVGVSERKTFACSQKMSSGVPFHLLFPITLGTGSVTLGLLQCCSITVELHLICLVGAFRACDVHSFIWFAWFWRGLNQDLE